MESGITAAKGPTAINASIFKAFKILQCFSYERPRLRLKEISQMAGISQPTAYRLLSTMKEINMIEQYDGIYTLGRVFLTFEGIVLRSMEIRNISLGFLEQLSNQTRVHSNLALLDGNEVIYIARVESKDNSYGYFHTGMRRPAYCTSLGKVLLCESPDEARKIFKRGIRRFTLNTIMDEEAFIAELEKVRLQGYATDFEEYSNGINCIAAPVRNAAGNIVAGISVSGPTTTFSKERALECVSVIIETSHRISERLRMHVGLPSTGG